MIRQRRLVEPVAVGLDALPYAFVRFLYAWIPALHSRDHLRLGLSRDCIRVTVVAPGRCDGTAAPGDIGALGRMPRTPLSLRALRTDIPSG